MPEKELIFRTSAPITYQLPDRSLYESIRVTGLGEVFPHIDPGNEETIKQTVDALHLQPNGTIIYSADTEQAKDTSEIVSTYTGLPYTLDPALRPPAFDLAELLSEKEFEELGNEKYNVLRARYIKGFYENKFLESKEDLYRRFTDLLGRYSQTEASQVLAVSHAFLMRFYEVFWIHGEKALTDYDLLVSSWKPEENPYGRLGGFSLRI